MEFHKFAIIVIKFYILTIIANLWDPTQWIHLYCTLPYFKLLYCWPDDSH